MGCIFPDQFAAAAFTKATTRLNVRMALAFILEMLNDCLKVERAQPLLYKILPRTQATRPERARGALLSVLRAELHAHASFLPAKSKPGGNVFVNY